MAATKKRAEGATFGEAGSAVKPQNRDARMRVAFPRLCRGKRLRRHLGSQPFYPKEKRCSKTALYLILTLRSR
jgi:hypothetical protein